MQPKIEAKATPDNNIPLNPHIRLVAAARQACASIKQLMDFNPGLSADAFPGYTELCAALAAIDETPSAELPYHLELLLLEATNHAGSYEPGEALSYIEERLTLREFDELRGFLEWIMRHSLAFGHGTIQARFGQYIAARTPGA